MAEADGDWATNSTEAFHISLVNSAGQTTGSVFQPLHTYSIFGEEESIFGYKGLAINLKYHASDMRPSFEVTYDKKFKAVGETEATDLKAVFEEYLPKTAFIGSKKFKEAIADDATNKAFTPPGELLKTISGNGQDTEIWMGSLSDPAVQQMLKRIQIMVPLFIEGGTHIDLEHPSWVLERWSVFFLYKRTETSTGSPYTFMGWSTVYRSYLYHAAFATGSSPKSSKQLLDFSLPLPEQPFSEMPCRSRISQFIILPPFQKQGLGAQFYEAIFDHYLAAPQTIEITVEDPNYAFDDLRDLNDLVRIRKIISKSPLEIEIDTTTKVPKKGKVPAGKIVDSRVVEKMRETLKIAPRQMSRLVEMYLLAKISSSVRLTLHETPKSKETPELKDEKHKYHLWQLLTKQRLYKHNKDQLSQLDLAERIDKLDQALASVEADYARLLRAIDDKDKGVEGSGIKRAAEDDGNALEPATKKVRIED